MLTNTKNCLKFPVLCVRSSMSAEMKCNFYSYLKLCELLLKVSCSVYFIIKYQINYNLMHNLLSFPLNFPWLYNFCYNAYLELWVRGRLHEPGPACLSGLHGLPRSRYVCNQTHQKSTLHNQASLGQPILKLQGPHSHILVMRGGIRGIFLGLKFWPKWNFLGVFERHRDYFGSRKKYRDICGYCTLDQFKSTIKSAQFTASVRFFWVWLNM